MESKPIRIIGIYKANGGLLGELGYILGHAVGLRHCELCDITHSPLRKKADFKNLEKSIKTEFDLDFKLVHMNERTERELAASKGREPCVLLEYSDGALSMLVDWVELKSSKGKVLSFERLLRSRLDFYL